MYGERSVVHNSDVPQMLYVTYIFVQKMCKYPLMFEPLPFLCTSITVHIATMHMPI